ncbi:MAG TPA: nuclear transport factor 2 family protein [Verrucomicrobiae bacterium]|nr:nuclear transport factor 2 family protein [Verrucomicrobiae bacterium]
MIRKLLTQMAAAASLKPNETALVRIAGANKLAGFFTADVVVRLDVAALRTRTINGRDELVEITTVARANLQEVKIQLHDIVVELALDRQTAFAQLTALANINGSTDPIFQLLKMRLKKIDGHWKISQVDTVKTPGV